MPTIITHGLAGLAGAEIFENHRGKWLFVILSIMCPIIPDLDVIGFKIGIPYESFFGHRGFFHSFFFALIISFIAVSFFRSIKFLSKEWSRLLLYFFILTSSHGILDAMTSGGLGIALLSPFDNTRYFFPFAPIKVAPISISHFFSEWGLKVIVSELIWVWIPLSLLVFLVRFLKKMTNNSAL